MPRKPTGPVAKTAIFSLRWRPATVATLDRLRGAIPRSRYLERLVSDEEQRQKEGQK